MLAALLGGARGHAQTMSGPQPGQGYGDPTDPAGHPYVHVIGPDPVPGAMVYTAVPVGTVPTLVLPPAPAARAKLYLLNPSGRPGVGGSATDVWCVYGGLAALGQGFILMGYGDRVTEDVPAVIDPRALSCIAPSPVTIIVGVVQQ